MAHRHEFQMHQRAGRIIDEDEQGAGRAAIFETVMIGAVDLDQLAIAFPAQAGLMEGSTLLAREPETCVLHPFAQRLARDLQAVIFRQLLGREGRVKVRVGVLDKSHRERADRRIYPVVRHPAAGLVPDRRTTLHLKSLQQPVKLPAVHAQHARSRHSRHPSLRHLAQSLDPVQLALAYQNPSHARCLCLFSLGQSVTLLLCRCGTF